MHLSRSWSAELYRNLEIPPPKVPDMSAIPPKSRARAMQTFTKRKKAYNSTRKKAIDDIVTEATLTKCPCKKLCLLNVGSNVQESLSMMKEYMTPWMLMGRTEHREKFFPLLEGCVAGVSDGGHLDKK